MLREGIGCAAGSFEPTGCNKLNYFSVFLTLLKVLIKLQPRVVNIFPKSRATTAKR